MQNLRLCLNGDLTSMKQMIGPQKLHFLFQILAHFVLVYNITLYIMILQVLKHTDALLSFMSLVSPFLVHNVLKGLGNIP